MGINLSTFRVAQATAIKLEVGGGIGVDQGLTVTYDHDTGQFTGEVHNIPGPTQPPFLLDEAQRQELATALKHAVENPQTTADRAVIQCFIHVLSNTPSSLFNMVRFGDINKGANDVIIVQYGTGVDVVGTLYDHHGRIAYEQHPVTGPHGQPRRLTRADRASLVVALEKFIPTAPPAAQPLYKQLLADAKK